MLAEARATTGSWAKGYFMVMLSLRALTMENNAMPVTVRMTNLFLQLGLDATPEGVARFIKEHRLPPEVNMLDADFWNDGQRQALTEMLNSDGEWALVVDQLNEALRPPES